MYTTYIKPTGTKTGHPHHIGRSWHNTTRAVQGARLARSYKNETTCTSQWGKYYAKPHPCIDKIPWYRGVNTTHTDSLL